MENETYDHVEDLAELALSYYDLRSGIEEIERFGESPLFRKEDIIAKAEDLYDKTLAKLKQNSEPLQRLLNLEGLQERLDTILDKYGMVTK